MNFLFINCFHKRPERTDIINNIVTECDVKHAYILDNAIPPLNKNINYQFINYEEVLHADYSFVDWKNFAPIDNKLREDFYTCESEYMLMAERHVEKGSLLNYSKAEIVHINRQHTNKYITNPPTYLNRLDSYLRHLRFWNDFFLKEKISCIIYLDNAPHNAFDFLIYSIAKSHNIPFILDALGPVPSYKLFVTDYKSLNNREFIKRLENCNENYEDSFSNKEFADEWVRINNANTGKLSLRPSEIKIRLNDKKSKFSFRRILKSGKFRIDHLSFQYLEFIFKYKRGDYFHTNISSYYNSICSDLNTKKDEYIFVPLHFQPEMTTSPMGGMYNYQLLMIEQLSFYLPNTHYLYVKEHPRQNGNYRSIEFYKRLISIPNVKLISKAIDSIKLIDNSVCVATITGTAGWEGLFRNKPFLMFGYHTYQFAPGVYPIRSNDDCRTAINEVLNKKIKIKKSDLKKYLLTYEKCSYPYNVNNKLHLFTSGLIKYIKEVTDHL